MQICKVLLEVFITNFMNWPMSPKEDEKTSPAYRLRIFYPLYPITPTGFHHQ